MPPHAYFNEELKTCNMSAIHCAMDTYGPVNTDIIHPPLPPLLECGTESAGDINLKEVVAVLGSSEKCHANDNTSRKAAYPSLPVRSTHLSVKVVQAGLVDGKLLAVERKGRLGQEGLLANIVLRGPITMAHVSVGNTVRRLLYQMQPLGNGLGSALDGSGFALPQPNT
uniref:Uncharacterized protein n=1 Tax=Anopheles coluzzii TaxID=1518534 RepID=A0A8W7PHV2_ANOCL